MESSPRVCSVIKFSVRICANARMIYIYIYNCHYIVYTLLLLLFYSPIVLIINLKK